MSEEGKSDNLSTEEKFKEAAYSYLPARGIRPQKPAI
jgi:hypothetical protein